MIKLYHYPDGQQSEAKQTARVFVDPSQVVSVRSYVKSFQDEPSQKKGAVKLSNGNELFSDLSPQDLCDALGFEYWLGEK